MGGRLHVIVPSADYASTFLNSTDRTNYNSLLARAESIESLDYPRPSEDAFLEAGRKAVEMSDVLIAIWDGQPARGKGGTADVVGIAQDLGRRVVVLWPSGESR